jgi:hypothetical protein
MSRESTYLEAVRHLRLPVVRAYLEGRGWVRGSDYRGTLAIFTKGANALQQLLVPINPEFDDFTERMEDVISRVAEDEGRTERSVLHDLYSGQVDTLRYRVQSPTAARGTLPLSDGISLLDGARRSLLAAACSVLAPERSYHPRMSRTEAEEFVDTCELGQTEEGSFAVVVRCPLRFTEDLTSAKEQPFARKATETLFQSVSDLVGALDQDRVGSLFQPIASHFSVSANLCDALMKMQSDAESGSVELSVSWASLLPKPGSVESSVRIRSELFPRIAEVGKILRGPAAIQSARFLARVDILAGSELDGLGRRYGEVKLSVLVGDDDEFVRARSVLDAEKYKVADEAHMRNRYVVVSGVLNRGARISTVTDVTVFELAAEQLPVFPSAP